MNNTCVIGGLGVVGSNTAKLFGIKKIFDLNGSTITLEEAAKCKFCFIALPTNVKEDGTYDTRDIEDVIKQIEQYGGAGIYIIRSTVWPGFADHLMDQLDINRIISNPEFLTETTAWQDTKSPPFILLGGAGVSFLEEIRGIYEARIKGANCILTDNTTAELAKLAMNGFFSTKVIFANQIYDYAQKVGANYERIREVLEKHPFGFKNHSEVWFKGKRGVTGKCLPKDSKALCHYSDGELIKKVMEINNQYIGQHE